MKDTQKLLFATSLLALMAVSLQGAILAGIVAGYTVLVAGWVTLKLFVRRQTVVGYSVPNRDRTISFDYKGAIKLVTTKYCSPLS